MKFFAQSHVYDDPWPIVSLAYFLRYPNPKAAHILSCDVISRDMTPSGTLLTTRLILKRGALPKWAPEGIVSRSESWVMEESEVDPWGRTIRCTTRNVEFTKVLQVEETVLFHQSPEGKTLQTTEGRIRSGFGWGLTKRIENYGMTKFKTNIQRSREGFSMVLELLRQTRLQPLGMGSNTSSTMAFLPRRTEETLERQTHSEYDGSFEPVTDRPGPIRRLKAWFGA